MKNRLLNYPQDHEPMTDDAPPDDPDTSWIARTYEAASRRIDYCMGKYPTATVAVGLSVGVLIGWMIKRR